MGIRTSLFVSASLMMVGAIAGCGAGPAGESGSTQPSGGSDDVSTGATASADAGDGDGSATADESTSASGDGDGDGDAGDGSTGDGDAGDADAGDGDGATGDGDGATGDGDGGTGDGDGDGGTGDGDGCQLDPSACGPAEPCNVITGQCEAPGGSCQLSGAAVACGPVSCGAGTACDDQGSCVPVAPCSAMQCVGGTCWGESCACDRAVNCSTPSGTDLNGAFAVDIGGLEFADDCEAWMVTLRSGTDFLRRLTPAGVLTEWAGVANLNMGEVKVLKLLAPQSPGTEPIPLGPTVGSVAITYTCCPTCGCFVDPPQGVARLLQGSADPLPIVIEAVPTQGSSPFGNNPASAGPMGLTWGDDLRLYVGNVDVDGDLHTADLIAGTSAPLSMLDARITASAPVSPVHLLVAKDEGTLYRFNTETLAWTTLTNVGAGVTALSHDSFDGTVYASLDTLEVIAIDPFTGDVTPFATMPGIGRVAVSPAGELWFYPMRFLQDVPLAPWPLPMSL